MDTRGRSRDLPVAGGVGQHGVERERGPERGDPSDGVEPRGPVEVAVSLAQDGTIPAPTAK